MGFHRAKVISYVEFYVICAVNKTDIKQWLCEGGKKRWAALFDPEKHTPESTVDWAHRMQLLQPDLVLYGGTFVVKSQFDALVQVLKPMLNCPLVLFPGDEKQLHESADALLLLSLLSGRNPEFLIGKHVKSALELRKMQVPVLSTAYLLLDGGSETSAQMATQTQPLAYTATDAILRTCIAAEQLGFSSIYLEGGSGAIQAVPADLIEKVKEWVSVPVWVGGGIRSSAQREQAWQAGADWVVMGNVFEEK